MANEKLLIIDGSSMLVTNYYGNLPKQILFEKDEEKKKLHYDKILHAPDGRYTNAIYGMIRTIKKIIDKQQPTHMVICFDKTRNTFRRELYADYKGNRGETPDPLKEQFKTMEDMLQDMGFVVEYSDTYEADDIAGSYAAKFEKDIPTFIMSKDHDYLQLISPYTRLWLVQTKQESADELMDKYYGRFGISKKDVNLPDKVFEMTSDICLEEYGVEPCQVPDWKGITGDTSDNIPGVKGVSSAAAPLLREYKTVEGIYEAIDKAPTAADQKALNKYWKESLGISRSPLNAMIQYKDSALLSKNLATIRKDYPIERTLEDLKINVNEEEKSKWLKGLGIKSL
ncbi:MAG: 5'-3' exonuclease [Butyrivibrio sp.]|nr:5'-3' exonuclease [Butyrivibrio sp.]